MRIFLSPDLAFSNVYHYISFDIICHLKIHMLMVKRARMVLIVMGCKLKGVQELGSISARVLTIERSTLSFKCPFQSHAQMQMVHTVAKQFSGGKIVFGNTTSGKAYYCNQVK